MARKNGLTGAIPGAGRKEKGNIKKNLNLSPKAVEILAKLPYGQAGEFVSNAILEYEKSLSK